MRFRLNCSNHPRLQGGITVSIDTTKLDVELGLFDAFGFGVDHVLELAEQLPREEAAEFLDAYMEMVTPNPHGGAVERRKDEELREFNDELDFEEVFGSVPSEGGTEIPVEKEAPDGDDDP